jgi:hypothetical protein
MEGYNLSDGYVQLGGYAFAIIQFVGMILYVNGIVMYNLFKKKLYFVGIVLYNLHMLNLYIFFVVLV